ncbi:HAD family hydrolase [Pseudoxanthomonas beigongshangi]
MHRPDISPAPSARAVDAVVFDLGGVLIDWNPRYLYRQLFGDDVAGMEWFLAEVCSPAWNAAQDAGRSWDEAVEEAIARHPDQAERIRAYRDRWIETLGEALAPTVQLLDELRDGGCRLYALTNWSGETFPHALERYPFLAWFDGIVVSGQERLAKPDPAIFHLLMERHGLHAARTVFIDDTVHNVEAAARLGMRAIHFRDAAQLRGELARLGVSPWAAPSP